MTNNNTKRYMAPKILYLKIKGDLYFKNQGNSRFRPVYARYKSAPSASFKKLFR